MALAQRLGEQKGTWSEATKPNTNGIDLNVSNIQANAKLAQLLKHQAGMAEVSSSILTGVNTLLQILFCFDVVKSLMPKILISSSLYKT